MADAPQALDDEDWRDSTHVLGAVLAAVEDLPANEAVAVLLEAIANLPTPGLVDWTFDTNAGPIVRLEAATLAGAMAAAERQIVPLQAVDGAYADWSEGPAGWHVLAVRAPSGHLLHRCAIRQGWRTR